MNGLLRLCVGLAVVWGTHRAVGDDRPLREARSANERFVLRVEPGRPGPAGRACQATLYDRTERDREGRVLWKRALVNETVPVQAFVRDDGRYVVTLDEFRRGGARNAVVIYGPRGELLRHFLLQDLLDKSDWLHVQVGDHELNWLTDARCRFFDKLDQFAIRLGWGHEIRIDLKKLRVLRQSDRAAVDVSNEIPPEILALLLGHLAENGELLSPGKLGELSTPPEAEQTLAPPATTQGAAAQPGDAPIQSGSVPLVFEAEAPTPQAPGIQQEPRAAEPGPAKAGTPQAGAAEAANANVAALTDIVVPAPNAAGKVDYVDWLNALGEVDGPDANPIYQNAFSQMVTSEVDGSPLHTAAMKGDPAALLSPEIGAWLDANASALQTFHQAAQHDAKGWNLHSEDGSLIAVLLPDLSQMRAMAKLSVLDGRRLLVEGQPAEAAARDLDAFAAAAHVGGGMTVIENLVGAAVQALATDAFLDLQADPAAAALDYVGLAAEADAACRPTRSAVDTIQGERAMFMDTAQRLWDVDPQTGARVFNLAQGRKFFGMIGDASEAETELKLREMTQTDYVQTVTEANHYYDAMTEAFAAPYQEGATRLAQLEARVEQGQITNPVLRTLVPSLGRYQFISTRAETARRASLLVTHLNAYRQQFGAYPPSLDAFAGRDFAVDPFSDAPFVYRREGDSFVLYSVAKNGTDDAGVHDRKGETNDLVFWPRPK